MELEVYNSLMVFTLLNLADVVTTYNVVRKKGFNSEANPIARFIFKKLGVSGMFAFKYVAMGLIVLVGALTNNLLESIWINNIILSLVVAWNSYVNHRLKSIE